METVVILSFHFQISVRAALAKCIHATHQQWEIGYHYLPSPALVS
jgi:hypothetical protein